MGELTIIGVQNINIANAPVVISFLKYANSPEDLKKLFVQLCMELKKLKKFKIKVVINKEMSSDVLIDFLNFAGFHIEGVFYKEDGFNDFIAYGKMLLEE